MRGGPTTVRIQAPDKKFHLAPADVRLMCAGPRHPPPVQHLGRHWRKNTLTQCSPPNIQIRPSQEPIQQGHNKRRCVGLKFNERQWQANHSHLESLESASTAAAVMTSSNRKSNAMRAAQDQSGISFVFLPCHKIPNHITKNAPSLTHKVFWVCLLL